MDSSLHISSIYISPNQTQVYLIQEIRFPLIPTLQNCRQNIFVTSDSSNSSSAILCLLLTIRRHTFSSALLCESKNREHENYFWDVIVLRGKSQSDAR